MVFLTYQGGKTLMFQNRIVVMSARLRQECLKLLDANAFRTIGRISLYLTALTLIRLQCSVADMPLLLRHIWQEKLRISPSSS